MPATLIDSDAIHGVVIAQLQSFADPRGVFSETFRKSWFPQRSWDVVQTNRSLSEANVVRGLHYHFHQVDYWCVMQGTIRAVLLDIRPDSPTFKQAQVVEMGGDNHVGLYIPTGVAHGFAALTPVILTYLVDNYYDSSDEYGVAWNDPHVTVDWGVETPTLSDRDRANPPLDQIPEADLPRLRP
jgi:dTDP-4-dehydrorhamnose 3,5-epimerase